MKRCAFSEAVKFPIYTEEKCYGQGSFFHFHLD